MKQKRKFFKHCKGYTWILIAFMDMQGFPGGVVYIPNSSEAFYTVHAFA